MNSTGFQKAMRFLASEDEEDDATPNSLSDQLDANVEARQFIETLPTLNAELYDLKRLHNDLRRDGNALREVWHDIAAITPARDAKLEKTQVPFSRRTQRPEGADFHLLQRYRSLPLQAIVQR